MKKLLFLTAFVVAGSFAFGQGTKFHQGDLASLQNQAKQNDQAYFVYFYSNNCADCATVDAAFSDASVASFSAANVPGMKIDMNSKKGSTLAAQYGVTKAPTTLFIGGVSGSVYMKLEYPVDHLDMLALMKRYNSVDETSSKATGTN